MASTDATTGFRPAIGIGIGKENNVLVEAEATLDFVVWQEVDSDTANIFTSLRSTRILIWSFAVTAGFLRIWSYRYEMPTNDCLSYLAIARAYERHDWQTAINSFWSPLYPWLLLLTFWITDASWYWESTIVHFLNFIIYVSALVCFAILLRELTAICRGPYDWPQGTEGFSPLAWLALGFATWTDISLRFSHLDRAAPDIGVAAVFLLATAILARLRRGGCGWLTYAGLGATLGIGYLAKSAMFPLAFVFLGCALFVGGHWKRTSLMVLLALVVFFAIGGPFIAALYHKTGRLTIGDSGKYNYAYHVNGVRRNSALGDVPAVSVFLAPSGVTYSPWYDPYFSNEAARPYFDWRQQMRAMSVTGRKYLQILSQQWVLVAGVLVLLPIFVGFRGVRSAIGSLWPIWLPSLTALALYALVHVERRYIVGPIVVLWCCVFASFRLPRFDKAHRLMNGMALMVALGLGGVIIHGTTRALIQYAKEPSHKRWEVAMSFQREGLRPGDLIAGLNLNNLYWAHLAQVRMVAKVQGNTVRSFYDASPDKRSEILGMLADAGARFLITETTPPASQRDGWRRVNNTHYFMLSIESFLNRSPFPLNP